MKASGSPTVAKTDRCVRGQFREVPVLDAIQPIAGKPSASLNTSMSSPRLIVTATIAGLPSYGILEPLTSTLSPIFKSAFWESTLPKPHRGGRQPSLSRS